MFILTSGLLAVISYRRYYSAGKPFRVKEFLVCVFRKDIYFHPSSIIDYKLFVANHFVVPVALIVGFISTTTIASVTNSALHGQFGAGWDGLAPNQWTLSLFGLVYLLASDFASFANDAVHHCIAFLWPLHSVHHSAEVLQPITLYRKHPLYNVLKHLFQSPTQGVVQGATAFAFLGNVDTFTILGINAGYALFSIMGSNLRHSHLWLSFGPFLNQYICFTRTPHHPPQREAGASELQLW